MVCAEAIMSDELFAEIVEQHAAVRQSAEAREGFRSFIEKRDASWYPGHSQGFSERDN
jgi:hypothetical protein